GDGNSISGRPCFRVSIAAVFSSARSSCRFRFQSGTGGLREIRALREMSPATFSVSIETVSKFFRFQLRLIDRLIDHTMNGCRISSTTQTTHVGLKPNVETFSYPAC